MIQRKVLQRIDTLDGMPVAIICGKKPRVLLRYERARTGCIPDVDLIVGVVLATQLRCARYGRGYLAGAVIIRRIQVREPNKVDSLRDLGLRKRGRVVEVIGRLLAFRDRLVQHFYIPGGEIGGGDPSGVKVVLEEVLSARETERIEQRTNCDYSEENHRS